MKKYIAALLLVFLLSPLMGAFAQEKTPITKEDYSNRSVEMADNFRAEGKIYVVVAVMVTLLGVLIFYVIKMDRQVTRLEGQVEEILNKKK